jgi:hypothetical protein
MALDFQAMRLLLSAIAAFILISPAWTQAAGTAAVIGSWEGESKCTIPDSPCHDEKALYLIATDKKNSAQLSVTAYKIVAGNPDFMGTLVCRYNAERATLSCSGNTPKQDDWEFHVSSNTLTGTLTIGAEKQLYRRITLHRAIAKTAGPKAN